MKSQAELLKEIETMQKGCSHYITEVDYYVLQALLNQNKEFVELIEKLNLSRYNWTIDEFIEELKSSLIGEKQ